MARAENYQLTNELRFVPRLDGDRWVRILQQKWVCMDEENRGAVDWRDVPFDRDGE